jgi:hypothetical protein
MIGNSLENFEITSRIFDVKELHKLSLVDEVTTHNLP